MFLKTKLPEVVLFWLDTGSYWRVRLHTSLVTQMINQDYSLSGTSKT